VQQASPQAMEATSDVEEPQPPRRTSRAAQRKPSAAKSFDSATTVRTSARDKKPATRATAAKPKAKPPPSPAVASKAKRPARKELTPVELELSENDISDVEESGVTRCVCGKSGPFARRILVMAI
jgi:hypothetical protein